MFTVAICTSFKTELFTGEHNILTDTIKLALYTDDAVINAGTTVYTTTDEVSGPGYTAGGVTLTDATLWTDGTTAGFVFSNPTFGPMTVSDIRAGLFYNSSVSDKAIAVIGFSQNVFCINQSLVIQFPANTTTNGLIKIL